MKFKPSYVPMFVLAVVLAVNAVYEVGCRTTLDPSGAYGTNTFLFNADRVIVESKDDLSAFLVWEQQNRSVLAAKKLTGVTTTADAIRVNAPLWFKVAVETRNAYSNAWATGSSSVTATSNSLALAITSLKTQTLSTHAITNSVHLENP